MIARTIVTRRLVRFGLRVLAGGVLSGRADAVVDCPPGFSSAFGLLTVVSESLSPHVLAGG
jgi:hypothetical protein